MRNLLVAAAMLIAANGCSTVKQVVVKDIPLEEQKLIHDTYKDRTAWTRGVLEDMGEGGSIPRDEKIQIAVIGLHYSGSVTVRTLKKRNKVTQALELERPLSKEKIDAKMEELFWFVDPTLRQVAYIRKWGKKTAQAIVDHEVFVGMTAEATVESWGFPAKRNINDIGGKREEQWIYPAGKRSKYVYIIDNKVSKWDD
ncbi:MAG: hypothetical protein OEO21_10435 [Candidatus Krumholzibacteria bacterium]|nr:hypothetical protein [Candidatus Krumholzibacteria bacterium]